MKRISTFQAWPIILFCLLGSLLVCPPVLAALKFPAYSNGIIGSYDTDINARDVALSGNYAYVVSGSNQIQIFDISAPESPQLIKTLATEGNEYTPKLFISGSKLYLASGGHGIRIIDISDPANPLELDPIHADQFANFGGWHTQGVFAGDSYIYVAANWNDFDGTNWNWKQGLLIFEAGTKAMVGQYVANDARGIYVSGNYAYLADGWQGGLKIINVSDPSQPTIAGSVATDGDARNVYVSGSYAYVADGWSGLAVVDISDPASPTKVAQEPMNNFEASDIFLDGNLVYLSDQSAGGLKCFDVTTPNNPKLRTLVSGNASYGVAVAGYAYLAAGDSGLKIIDIGVAVEPKQVGYFPTSQTREVFVSGNYAYIADGWDGFKIYDISNPAKPVKKGDITNLNAEVRGVVVSGDYAYLGCGDQGFKVVDISNPEAPGIVGNLSAAGYQYWEVLVSGSYAYVKGRKDDWANDGLIIVNISSATNPSQAGTLEIGTWFDRFDKAGDYVYLASGNNGLRIIDVSNPASPEEASSIGLNHHAQDVAVLGSYAYVANHWGGLYVVDITDPTKPVLAGVSEAQNTRGVAAIEGHVFTFTDKGVCIFDTTLPQAPILIGTMEYGSDWWDRQIIAANGYLYLSGHDKGLHIVSPYPIPAREGEALSYTIPTSAGSTYAGFSIDAGAQVTGMSIDGSGVLSWSTPGNADVGLHEIQVTAGSDQLTYHLWVENLNQSPSITAPGTTLAWKHSALNTYQVAVTDDDLNAPGYTESFVYQVDAGSLSKGISIDTQGVLKWTPGSDSVGDYSITVTVTDKAGASASQNFAVKVFDFSQKIAQVSGTAKSLISNARDVKVAGEYAYMAGDDKLYILEAGDLETAVATVNDLWGARAVDVLGDYAYVACGWSGLRIIDISTPGSPNVSLGANGGQGYKIQEQSWYNNVTIEEKNGKTYAYAVGGKEGGIHFFEVIDVSNPAVPVNLGNVDTSNEDWPSAVRVSGNYAFVAYGWDGLKIYDISNLSSINLAGKIDGIGQIRDVVLGGTYAYLAAYWSGMQVVDISDPTEPALSATYFTNDANTSFRGIDTQGDYVYMSSYAGDKVALDIVDVSAPLSPQAVDTVKVDGSSNDIMGVDFSGDFVYAAFGSGGVKAFSSLTIMAEKGTLFSFETPVIEGSSFQLDAGPAGMSIDPDTGVILWESPDQKEDGTSLYELAITYKDASSNNQTINYLLWVQNVNTKPSITAAAETLAWKYGVQNSYQVEVVDTDTAVKGYNESFTFSVDNASAGKGVFINNKGLLTWSPTADQAGEQTITVTVQDKAGATASQDFAVKVFNIKQVPTVVGSITGLIENARVVKVQANYAYVLDNNSLRILDITDINNPVKVGSAPCNDPRDLVLSGNYAYVADGGEGLRVVDISDKTAPQIVATFKSMSEGSWCHYESLALNGNYAYLAGEREQQRVMDVVDISDPTAPSLVQTESSYEVSNQNNDNFQSIKVSGNYAYLAQGWNGLTVLDVSNPGNITKVGGLQNIGWSRDLVLDVDGNYVYMAADWDGLKVVDITDPANPKVVGQFNPNDIWTQGIDVNGDYVYLASQTNQGGQLDIIDISDPYTPQSVGSIAGETDSFNQVDFEGDYLYVAGGSGGVTVLSAGAVQAAEGTTLSFEVPVIGGSSFDIDAASTAKGISIDNTTGVLSWDAPSNADVGLHQVVVSYTKSGASNSESYPIWVQNLNQSPQVAASESTLAWILNVKNHFVVQVSDEDQNAPGYHESFTFQVDGTSSAKGISVDSNGNLVWNPGKSDVGEHTLKVTVTDAAGASAQQTFNIQVFDLSLSPVQVGIIDEQLSNVRGLAVGGNYAYVLDNNRLNIYYVNNVNSPELVGGIKFVPQNCPECGAIGNPRDITLSGKYAYVALEWGGLQIVDATSKSAPSALISEVNDDYGQHYFKTGNNQYQTIAVSGDYAYASGWTESGGNWYNFLEVIDVSNPEAPVSKDVYMFTGSNLESIKVFGDYVIAAAGWEGLRAFDVSDPTEIQPAGAMQTNQHAYDLAVDSKGYAYLANEWGGLKVINISDPKDPSFAGGLGVSLNYNARSIDIFGNYAYLAGNKPEGAVLSIIDISDPLSPKLVDNLEIDTDHVFDQVDFTRAYAFVGSGADGVRIISPQTVLGQEGKILSFEIPVVNATGYSFALDGVSGQKGMTVDAAGTVNWDTPVNADVGLHEVKAFVTDASGSAGKLTYQVWVENVNQAPAFAAGMANTLDWYWNVTNTFKLPIDDDDLYAPGYKESFTYGIDVSQVTGDTKPEIDANTGVIVWTPGYTQESDTGYPVTITVTDAAGEAAATNITLKVKIPDVPFGSDYHTQENAQVFQITGKPMVSSLIEESDLIQPNWFKFTLDEKNKVLLSLSTQGQSDYLVELVSGQTDMTFSDLLADNKGIIAGNVAVSDTNVMSWTGIIEQARGIFFKDGYLFSVRNNELNVYSLNEGPVEVGFAFLGVGPFANVKSYQGHTYAQTANCMTWEQAQALAEKTGGYLAVVDDQDENQFFDDNYAWNFIGYNDIVAEGTWVLADGKPADFINWSEGQPDDAGGNEDVAQILGDGTWNDVPDDCGLYIIEWEVLPNNLSFAFKEQGNQELLFDWPSQISANRIVVHNSSWDGDLQKDLTYKGAVDISDPDSPKWLGQINEGEVRSQWTTWEEYIYSASDWGDGSDKVYVYHASDDGLAQVNMLEDFNANTQFQQVMAGDNVLLIKAHNSQNPHLTNEWGTSIHHCLFIYDLADPASPVLINVIEAGDYGAVWDLVTVSQGYAVFNKPDGTLASFDLDDLQTGSGFVDGEGKIQPIGSVAAGNYDLSKKKATSPIMYLPHNLGNTFDVVHMAANGKLKRLISIEDKGYLKAVMPGGQTFLAASTAALNAETIYSLYNLEVQEGAWVYESFEVKSGTGAQANWWEPQQEEEDSFGYDSVAVGLEPGTYYVKVSDDGGFDSTQKYALSCSVEGAFTVNTETQTVPIADTPSVYEDSIFSLLDTTGYLFTVAEDLQTFLEFENPSFSSDYTLSLVNDSLWSQEKYSLSAGQDLISSFNLAAGDYTLILENSSVVDALSDYTLSLSTLETDGNKETESNNDYSTADVYVRGEEFSGHIAHNSDYDYFVFNLGQSKALDVEISVLEASAGSFRLDLILSGVVIDTMNVEAGTFEKFNLGLFPGRYFIRISGSGVDSTDEYSFILTEIEGVDQEFEPNNEKQFANSVSAQTVKQGRLYGNGDVDWYAFNCIETGLFIFDFNGQGDAEENYNVQILNIGGTPIMKFQLDGNQSNSDMKGLYPGNYYIRISGSAIKTGKYTFEGIGQIAELKELLALTVSSENDVYDIDKDGQLQLTAAANYSDGSVADISGNAEWKSLNTEVADVSVNGLVTGNQGGAATITVSYGDKETKKKTASFTVNVIDPDIVTKKFAQTYGNLIIVAGGGVGAANKLANTTQSLCDYVYMKFKGRGFEDEDIYYLNPVSYKDLNGNGFDDQIVDQTNVTVANFFGSIDSWAKGYPTNGPLYIYLNDHGAADMFQLYPGQILAASQFASSLDNFQAATGRKIVVIIEACHSGTFVDNLQAQDRLVVTSSDDGLSYLGDNGAASFSMFFMDALYKGSTISTAYSDSLLQLTDLGKPYDMMNPQYADQGGQFSDLYVVGDFALAPLFAEIIEVTLPDEYAIGSGGINIEAQVTGAEGGSVWVTVKPKDFEPPPAIGDFDTPDIQLPTVTLIDEKQQQFDQIFEGTSDEFVVDGVYEIVIFAKDSEGNVTKSSIYEVSVTGSGNIQWPQAAFDYSQAQIQVGDEITFTDASTDDGTIVSWSWDFGDEASSSEQHPTHTYNQTGVYTVTLTVTDDYGADNNYSALVTVGGTYEQIEVGVAAGWNLLSSRIGFSVSEKFSYGAKFVSAWKWQDGGWAVYLPGESDGGAAYAAAKGFTVLSTINPGEGFWVNAVEPETVTMSGIAASDSLSLSGGWNLVGLKGDQGKSITDLISGNETAIVSVWKWDSGTWAVYLPDEGDGGAAYAGAKGFNELSVINPGEGFWMNCTEVVTLE